MKNDIKFLNDEEKQLWMKVYLFYLENGYNKIQSPDYYADIAVKEYRLRCNI